MIFYIYLIYLQLLYRYDTCVLFIEVLLIYKYYESIILVVSCQSSMSVSAI